MESNNTNYSETWTAPEQRLDMMITLQYEEYLALVITTGMTTLISALLAIMNILLLKSRSSFRKRLDNVELF